ncbi:MAG: response regulator [Alphaproteobacteria bacterium]|nr:response regulator [Alphaproteobacteria bacterium]
MQVLLVEDNVLLAVALQAELEVAGYGVIGPAHSAAQARALANEHDFEVAVIDIDLQDGRTGGTLAKELSHDHSCAVVFATGQTHLAREWCDYAVGVLKKPFNPKTVVRTVEGASEFLSGKTPAWPYQFEKF